ncbi:hypothetical protein F558DRAFT_02168 [Streptomyces sp. AmelKG-A3]|nr:hypothetical protein GA0115247_104236 [Streptomyces sp. PalvLS-984]SDC57469.1 hypothetical protein F558DRAFT_02168 [Streptomyces sp. AmelKG-A3]
MPIDFLALLPVIVCDERAFSPGGPLASVLMTRRVAPVRERIRKALAAARTSEPYPVWMTWPSLAVRVYGYGCGTKSDVQNIRRAAEQMHDVEMLRYGDSGRHAGPRLCGTPEESWLRCHVTDVHSGAMYGVDAHGYRPPSSDEVLSAFRNGCYSETPIRVNLQRVVALVNKRCGTAFDPSEVAWWRVGLEEKRCSERRDLLHQMRCALSGLAVEKERCERELRQIDFGRIVVDPATVTRCPCCQQKVDSGFFPAQRPAVVSMDA